MCGVLPRRRADGICSQHEQSATLREELSMLKSLMELEELARRVVGRRPGGRSRSRPGVAADSARPGRAGKRSERMQSAAPLL